MKNTDVVRFVAVANDTQNIDIFSKLYERENLQRTVDWYFNRTLSKHMLMIVLTDDEGCRKLGEVDECTIQALTEDGFMHGTMLDKDTKEYYTTIMINIANRFINESYMGVTVGLCDVLCSEYSGYFNTKDEDNIKILKLLYGGYSDYLVATAVENRTKGLTLSYNKDITDVTMHRLENDTELFNTLPEHSDRVILAITIAARLAAYDYSLKSINTPLAGLISNTANIFKLCFKKVDNKETLDRTDTKSLITQIMMLENFVD